MVVVFKMQWNQMRWWWRVVGDEVGGECGAASDAFGMMWNQMRWCEVV